MKPREQLTKALALIEAGWCRGTEARDKDGNSVVPLDSTATCYCIMGALVKVTFPEYPTQAVDQLRSMDFSCGLATWNDAPGRTKEEVVNLFKEAINDCS